MKKEEFIGLSPIKISGSLFETGFGISKFVKFKLNGKLYAPVMGGIMNTFGVDPKDRIKDKIFCSLEEKSKFLEFYSKSGDIECPRWIAAAPTLRIGEGLWSPSSNFYLGKVKDYKKMQTTIKFKSIPTKGFFDFSYDLWFTKKEHQKNLTNNEDLEIMIVIDSNFKFPNKGRETEYNGMRVVYHQKKQGSNRQDNKGWEVSFIVSPSHKSLSFDIMDLLKFSSKLTKINFTNHYISSLDIINEFASNSEVKIELTDLEFDFVKKYS